MINLAPSTRGVVQLGSVLFGTRGRKFESCHPDSKKNGHTFLTKHAHFLYNPTLPYFNSFLNILLYNPLFCFTTSGVPSQIN